MNPMSPGPKASILPGRSKLEVPAYGMEQLLSITRCACGVRMLPQEACLVQRTCPFACATTKSTRPGTTWFLIHCYANRWYTLYATAAKDGTNHANPRSMAMCMASTWPGRHGIRDRGARSHDEVISGTFCRPSSCPGRNSLAIYTIRSR